MKCNISVLYADPDVDFRESLLNHLLLCGYDNVQTAKDKDDLIRLLAGSSFDLLFLDYNLYDFEGTRAVVDGYHRQHNSDVVLILNDEVPGLIKKALKTGDIYLCIPKSSVWSLLTRCADG